MSNKMEDILGLGPINTKRIIPGTSLSSEREFRYIGCSGNTDVKALFKSVIRKVNPPLASSGGALNEGCTIILPSGESYFAVSYKGDIDGWRQQIEQGATELGLPVAKIDQERLLLSCGKQVFLSDCKVCFT